MEKVYRLNAEEAMHLIATVIEQSFGERVRGIKVRIDNSQREHQLECVEVICDVQPKDSVQPIAGQSDANDQQTTTGRTGEPTNQIVCQPEDEVAQANCACHAHDQHQPDTKEEVAQFRNHPCPHNPEYVIAIGSFAHCKQCGTILGWWCPISPTKTCDYTQEDGSYNEDDCRYCHEPDERK